MKFFLLFSIIILFSFCNKKENNLPRIINSEYKKVVEVNCNNMIEFSSYNLIYINFTKDFSLKESRLNLIEKDKNFTKEIDLRKIIPRHDIKVFVDTTYTFAQKGFTYLRIPFPRNFIIDGLINRKIPTKEQYRLVKKDMTEYYKVDNGSNDFVKCYPLLMYNNSKDTIITKFKYIQEAKDSKGNWKPIECYYNFGECGNPEMYCYQIVSKNYILYPIIKYHGNFKTKLRVKVYNKRNVYYSNEFTGYINISQFDTKAFREKFNKINPTQDFNESSDFFFLNK